MKAIVVERIGTPDVMELREVPRPAPRAGQVLLRVEAVGVNFADALSVGGQYLTATKVPYVPGMELAGTVVELGEGVTNVQVGQRVAALGGTGGLAEYAAVPAAGVVPVPESFTPAQAAAFPVSFMTAYHALKTLGRGEAGEWVLVQAAAGALGTASVQLAKALGMNVIALASTEEKLQLARNLGADVTILQDDPDRVQKVRDAAGADEAQRQRNRAVAHLADARRRSLRRRFPGSRPADRQRQGRAAGRPQLRPRRQLARLSGHPGPQDDRQSRDRAAALKLAKRGRAVETSRPAPFSLP